MAPESIRDYLYTSKSDVWGFGILLWELETLGSSPYPGLQPEKLFGLLMNGYRMQRPAACSLAMYHLMLACWELSPDKRPSFKSLTHKLEQLLQSNATYLELDKTETSPTSHVGYLSLDPSTTPTNIVNNITYQEMENIPLISSLDHAAYLSPDAQPMNDPNTTSSDSIPFPLPPDSYLPMYSTGLKPQFSDHPTKDILKTQFSDSSTTMGSVVPILPYSRVGSFCGRAPLSLEQVQYCRVSLPSAMEDSEGAARESCS